MQACKPEVGCSMVIWLRKYYKDFDKKSNEVEKSYTYGSKTTVPNVDFFC